MARVTVAEITAAAAGRELELLAHVAEIKRELLDGKKHPCPKCKGADRFNYRDGKVYCRKCCPKGNAPLWAIAWNQDCDLATAIARSTAYLGLNNGHRGNGRNKATHVDLIERIATAKSIPDPMALVMYGARQQGNRVSVPMYDAAGERCSEFWLDAHGKGKNAARKPSGLVLPHDEDGHVRLPLPGETWHGVEGCKDAATLHHYGHLTFGLPGCRLNAKFARLFSGCTVVLVPDLDQPSLNGAKQAAARLAGVAKAVKLVRLPGELTPTKGDDCRDVIRKHGIDALQQAIRDAVVVDERGEPRPVIKPISAGELVDRHKRMRPVVIDGLARVGETINVVAASKTGKSWLVYGLLMAMVRGDDWLGAFGCQPGRCLLIDNELHQETLADRLGRVANAMDVPADRWRDAIKVVALRGKLVDLIGLAEIIDSTRPGEFDVVVADSFYRFLPEGVDENSNPQIAQCYNRIDAYAEQLRAVWVNIHHSSKGDQSAKSVTDVGAGAGSQSRAADSHLILRPHEQDDVAVVDAAVRSFPPIESFAIRWEWPLWQPTDANPAKLRRPLTSRELKQQADDDDGKAKIIAALSGHWMTNRQLRGETGLSRDRVTRLIGFLESEGRVISQETEAGGKTTYCYGLPPVDDDPDFAPNVWGGR